MLTDSGAVVAIGSTLFMERFFVRRILLRKRFIAHTTFVVRACLAWGVLIVAGSSSAAQDHFKRAAPGVFFRTISLFCASNFAAVAFAFVEARAMQSTQQH